MSSRNAVALEDKASVFEKEKMWFVNKAGQGAKTWKKRSRNPSY